MKATEHDTLKLLDEAPDTGRSGTTEEEKKGKHLVNLAGMAIYQIPGIMLVESCISSSAYKTQKRDDRLVIPTTIGRERDETHFCKLWEFREKGRRDGGCSGFDEITTC